MVFWEILFIGIPIIMVVIAFINLNFALSMYVVYLVCVPYLDIKFMGISLGYNIVHIFLLIAFFINLLRKKHRLSITMIKPYIFFFFTTFLIIFVQDRIPIETQLNLWRRELMLVVIVPLIIYNLGLEDKSLVRYMTWALYISLLIAGIYAVYLLTLPPGINPYLMATLPLNGQEYKLSYADDAVRSMERIFSTFSHPLAWCMFLSFFIIVFWNFYGKINKSLYYFIMFLAVFDLIFCGVRTGIAALSIPVIYLIIMHKKMKYIINSAIILFFLALVVINNKTLFDYFYSIVDSSQTTTQGSNLEMRLFQWEGCIEECRGRELVGNGYRWTEYYLTKYISHPKAIAFESLIFVIYTNWGILGFLIWGLTFYFIFKSNRYGLKDKMSSIKLNAVLMLYIIFSTLTGEYGYMRWFALLHSILYIYLKNSEPKEIETK